MLEERQVPEEAAELHASNVWETAAEHLTARVPVAAPSEPVLSVWGRLAGQAFDSAVAVAVCDGGQLVGIASIECLLAARGDQTLGEIMDRDPPRVRPGVDQEVAAWQAVQHGESCLAVVGLDGEFRGLIPPQQLLRVLLWEHDEDLARMGGFLRDTSRARRASSEPVVRRLWHRLPWLMLGLVGAVASAHFVSAFERQLSENVMLAFFLPGIVYLADAVGTQTETLVVRGLSLGVSLRAIFRRELLTGLLIGAGLAAAFWCYASWHWQDESIVTAVALALMAACSIATAIAMVLPWLLNRAGLDPAFGSGPLATVVQDLLSIVIYFAICSWAIR